MDVHSVVGIVSAAGCCVDTVRKESIMTHTNTARPERREMTRPDLAHEDAHDLMPPWLAETVPALLTTEYAHDPLIHVKLFTPDAGWMWYITEYDPERRLAYGFVRGTEEALAYISLNELAARRGPMGLAVERDLFWRATPLSRVRCGAVR
jgi:hypothetical protein